MKKYLAIAWALLLCGLLCLTQADAFFQSRDSNYNKAISAGASYTGPGDVVSGAVAWWGLRCYNNAYAGSVIDLVDKASGNTTGTRLQCAAGGTISALVSGSACTFVTGNACSSLATTCATACVAVTWYDQSGGTNCSAAACNITQATNSLRPQYFTGCVGSLPCLFFSGAAQGLSKSAGLTTAQPYTMSSTWQNTNGNPCANNDCAIINSDPSGNFIEIAPNDSNVAIFMIAGAAGALTPNSSYTQSVLHNIQAVFNGASPVVNLDGTSLSLSGTVGTSALANSINVGLDGVGGGLGGLIQEAGVWPIAFSTTQQNNMCHNQFTYWGTSTSC